MSFILRALANIVFFGKKHNGVLLGLILFLVGWTICFIKLEKQRVELDNATIKLLECKKKHFEDTQKGINKKLEEEIRRIENEEENSINSSIGDHSITF